MIQIEENILDCAVVSLNEISEVEREVRREVKKIIKKHEKSHLVKPIAYIQVSIRTSKDTVEVDGS